MSTQRTGQSGRIVGAITSLLSCHDLPEEPPGDPMPLLLAWYTEAERSGRYDDFNAMTVATATPDGVPSARIVLCKAIETDPPALVFYTSYRSRKGRDLEANPRAAAVFHWPHAKRQVRIEGNVERVSDAEADAYFRTNPLLTRIGASATGQVALMQARTDLVAAAMKTASLAVLSGELVRPAHWGGYRLQMTSVELWSARQGRLHDRIRWDRTGPDDTVAWSAERSSA